GAGGNARRRLARALPSTTAIIAYAIFRQIGIVRMTGAELVADLRVVARTLVDILDYQRDRCSGRHLRRHAFVLEHAGEDLHRVGFLALRYELGLARSAAVQIALDVRFGQRDAWRAAIDHAADRRPMAFAEGRDPKQVPEAVVRHGLF